MKNVLITGASGDIGAEIAINFAKNGYNVGIHYNTSKEKAKTLLKAVKEYGVDAEIFQADVSNYSEVETLCKNFIDRFKSIDALINNAGISKIAPINDLTNFEWDKIISVNLSSAFYFSKALLPYFLKNKNGNIVNISSIWGVNGASCEVAYSASKAGLIGFTKALSKELGPSGIRVNAVSPGMIDTKMNNSIPEEEINAFLENTALGLIGTAKNVADTVYFLCSENASYITGENIVIDGGIV